MLLSTIEAFESLTSELQLGHQAHSVCVCEKDEVQSNHNTHLSVVIDH